jgi:hypothetical protein
METYIHLYYYLAEFFLEREMFQINALEKIWPHIICSIRFSRESCHLINNVEKYGRARQATDDNIVWCTLFACWISKAADTHPEYLTLIAFPQQIYLGEASQW